MHFRSLKLVKICPGFIATLRLSRYWQIEYDGYCLHQLLSKLNTRRWTRLTSTILKPVIEDLHTISAALSATWYTIALGLSKSVTLIVILRLRCVFKILGPLHWRTGQNLVALFERIWDGCIGLFEAVWIVDPRSSLLWDSIWLALLLIDSFGKGSTLQIGVGAVCWGDCWPLGRSLREITCVAVAMVIFRILRVGGTDMTSMLVASTNGVGLRRLSSHRRVCGEGCLGLCGLEVVFDHLEARARRLDDIVVFYGPKVEQRLFLNCFARMLGLLRIVPLARIRLSDCWWVRVFVIAWNLSYRRRRLLHEQILSQIFIRSFIDSTKSYFKIARSVLRTLDFFSR